MDEYATYFDAKREIKKIHGFGLQAIKRKDKKYINFLLLSLDQLEQALSDKFNLDRFGLHVIQKDIDGMRLFLDAGLKKKIAEDAYEKKSRTSIKQRT